LRQKEKGPIAVLANQGTLYYDKKTITDFFNSTFGKNELFKIPQIICIDEIEKIPTLMAKDMYMDRTTLTRNLDLLKKQD